MDVICLIHSLFMVKIMVVPVFMMYVLAIVVNFLKIRCISVVCPSRFLLVRRSIAIDLIFIIALIFIGTIRRLLRSLLFSHFLRTTSELIL